MAGIIMKIKRMDNRFRACKDWGYMYQVTFASHQWREFYEFKALVTKQLGASEEIFPSWMWRDRIDLLKTAPWAWHNENSQKPNKMFFREGETLERMQLIRALTAKDPKKTFG
jgi:hypothetical protein